MRGSAGRSPIQRRGTSLGRHGKARQGKARQGRVRLGIRAFFHVSDGYTPVDVVLKTPDKRAELEQSALREMKAFQEKFRIIKELAPVFKAMNTAMKKIRPRGEEKTSAPV